MDAVWTVVGITRYIREMFDIDYRLQDLWVEGEISNFSAPVSGHYYMVIKDEKAQIRAVMFRLQTRGGLEADPIRSVKWWISMGFLSRLWAPCPRSCRPP